MFEQLFPELTLEKLCEAIRRANRNLLESTDNPGSILKVFESVLAALDRVLGNALQSLYQLLLKLIRVLN